MNPFTSMRRAMMLTCEDVNGFLAAYLEGVLAPDVQRRFERHVARCAQCTAYLNQYRHVVAIVHERPLPAPPEALVEMTLRFLRRHYGDPR